MAQLVCVRGLKGIREYLCLICTTCDGWAGACGNRTVRAGSEAFVASCSAEDLGPVSVQYMGEGHELLPFLWHHQQAQQLPDLPPRLPGYEEEEEDEGNEEDEGEEGNDDEQEEEEQKEGEGKEETATWMAATRRRRK